MRKKRTKILFILTNLLDIYAISHKKSNEGHKNKAAISNTLKKLLEKLTVKLFNRKSPSISLFIISKPWIIGNTAMKAYSLLST